MLRKVIWSCTAFLACVVLAVTMAAYYVAENPDSTLAQAAILPWDIFSWFNPALTASRMNNEPLACAKPCPAAEPWCPGQEAAPPEAQEPPMPEVVDVPAVAEPIVVEDITLPMPQESQEPPPMPQAQPAPFMDPSHEAGMDDVPTFMPYAEDDDAVLHQAMMDKPDVVTQLLGYFMNPESPCDQEHGCALFAEAIAEFLKELAGEETETTSVPVLPDDPVESTPDNQEPPMSDVVEPMATEALLSGLAQEELEKRNKDQDQGATGATTGVGGVIGTQTENPPVTSNPPVTEDQNATGTPTGAANPATGTPENPDNPTSTDVPNPGATNMQEDPSYHHQYPSCPYTGQCPYTGHCPYPYYYNVPSVPYTETAPQPKEKTKPKKPVKTKPAKPTKKPTPSLMDWDAFGDPYVDTMECRPSDVAGYLPGTGPY